MTGQLNRKAPTSSIVAYPAIVTAPHDDCRRQQDKGDRQNDACELAQQRQRRLLKPVFSFSRSGRSLWPIAATA